MAMPAATAALMLRVEPNWAIDTVTAAPALASSVMPGPSWPKISRQSRGSAVSFEPHRAGHVVDGDDGQPRIRGEGQQVGGGVVVAQPLVAVGHHGAAPVPASTADDVHGVDGERVGGPHHRADVGVVAEVLDRDVQRMPASVDVGDDRVTRPVPVCVNDVAGVAVAQQRGVVPRIVGQRTFPRADAGRLAPFGGAGRSSHRVVHSPAWVPTSDTVAYSSAALISPCVHSDARTWTASQRCVRQHEHRGAVDVAGVAQPRRRAASAPPAPSWDRRGAPSRRGIALPDRRFRGRAACSRCR